jgi:hypothetical protein
LKKQVVDPDATEDEPEEEEDEEGGGDEGSVDEIAVF